MKALLLCLSLMLTGCNLMGYRNLSPENVAKIQRGVTTQKQVESMLGLPVHRSFNADGTVGMFYANSMAKPVPLVAPT